MTWQIVIDDCVTAMAAMPANSVDAICTDPPYGLEFMGKDWDAPWKDAARAASATTVEPAGIGGFQDGAGGNAFSRSRVRTDTARHGGDVGTANRGFQAWCEAWAREALRVLKPGGHLLAFGGTRTYHRLAAGIEDAGFEIRDTISWMYGSGFPKSLDVSKAIDKTAGAEREVVGRYVSPEGTTGASDGNVGIYGAYDGGALSPVTAPATADAKRWEGWGTALKPAHEPIVVARKPLSGTVAANVLAHGTGALNVDGCRIEACGETIDREDEFETTTAAHDGYVRPGASKFTHKPKQRSGPAQIAGRWPANVVLSHTDRCAPAGTRKVKSNAPAKYVENGAEATLYREGFGRREPGDDRPGYADPDGTETIAAWDCHESCPVRLLDEQTGDRRSAGLYEKGSREQGAKDGAASIPIDGLTSATYADQGGASRFFYCSKSSSAERNAGLDGFAEREQPAAWGDLGAVEGNPRKVDTGRVRNPHPTVKPIELMRWLIRLVTPPGGLVLDPFAGSGTTGIAAVLERVSFVGVERDPEYAAIARARIGWWAQHPEGMDIVNALEGDRARRQVADTGQTSLFDTTPTTDDEEAA